MKKEFRNKDLKKAVTRSHNRFSTEYQRRRFALMRRSCGRGEFSSEAARVYNFGLY